MKYADRLAQYLNQTAQLQKKGAADGYGNLTYGVEMQINVRKEGKTRLVRDTKGETVASSTTIFSLEQIDPMDKVDGALVINSMSMVDGGGNIIGWESYL